VRVKADTNESNTGPFKEVSASKVALHPLLMPPTLPIEPQPAAIHSVQPRPASLPPSVRLLAHDPRYLAIGDLVRLDDRAYRRASLSCLHVKGRLSWRPLSYSERGTAPRDFCRAAI
jgi:hypothetical protein